MKLLSLIILLPVLTYHSCIGYPGVEGSVSEDLLEKETVNEYWIDTSNETISNDSLPLEMHGFGKKVVNKAKDGIKTVKDKIKDKDKQIKDKIGGGGGGYYRDGYDRDYQRRNNKIKGGSGGGGGSLNSIALWVGIGVVAFIVLSALIIIIYYKLK